jgi:hypothetical protein
MSSEIFKSKKPRKFLCQKTGLDGKTMTDSFHFSEREIEIEIERRCRCRRSIVGS